MADFISRFRGTEFLLKEPFIFIWLGLGLSFLAVNFSLSVSVIYSIMLGVCVGIWMISKNKHIAINDVRGNSTMSILYSLIVWSLCILGLNMVFLTVFGNAFSMVPTLAEFFKQNSAAFLGATTPALENSRLTAFLVFAIIIPIIETILYVSLFRLVLNISKIPILKSSLKDLRFYGINAIFAVGAIFFHMTAKGTTSFIPLLMVFSFFFWSGIIGTIPFFNGHSEMESSIWLHILNNSLAVLKTIKII